LNYTRLLHLAEKNYLIAIDTDPKNVWPLCNYATFLWEIKKDLKKSEEV
jgi:Tfp pilus assembly protein PilF